MDEFSMTEGRICPGAAPLEAPVVPRGRRPASDAPADCDAGCMAPMGFVPLRVKAPDGNRMPGAMAADAKGDPEADPGMESELDAMPAAGIIPRAITPV